MDVRRRNDLTATGRADGVGTLLAHGFGCVRAAVTSFVSGR